MIPLTFIAIALFTAGLKTAHHWLSNQVKKVEREQGEGHTLPFHFKAIASLIVLLIADVGLITVVLNLLTERKKMLGYAIAADSLSLPPLMWLIMVEYCLSCYHHYSEEEPKSREMHHTIASTIHQSIRLLNYSAFFFLEYKFGKVRSNMVLQLGIHAATLSQTLLVFQKQVRGVHKIVSKLQTISPHDKRHATSLCLICREHLNADEQSVITTNTKKSPTADHQDAPRSSSSTTSVKRLPCGHLFHAPCLAGWLHRTLQCPTCRKAVL